MLRSGQSTPPIDLNAIARLLEINVSEEELDEDISGLAFCKDGAKFVVVNSTHAPNRRRFTLAHEIAHHALHENHLLGNVHVDGRRILRRDELSAKGKDLMEIEANNFAAELLMPSPWLAEFLPPGFDPEDKDKVYELAVRFGVSEAAFYYRVLSP